MRLPLRVAVCAAAEERARPLGPGRDPPILGWGFPGELTYP